MGCWAGRSVLGRRVGLGRESGGEGEEKEEVGGEGQEGEGSGPGGTGGVGESTGSRSEAVGEEDTTGFEAVVRRR